MSDQPARKRLSLASHSVIYGIGNIARQVVGFLMLPIYTRFLSPADYGAVGLLSFALSLLEPFFGARLAAAVPKFYFATEDAKARSAVVSSALILTGAVSAVTACLIAVFSAPASEFLFDTHEYAVVTALFGLNMLTQPIEYTGMMYLRMHERSVLFLWLSIGKMILQIITNILFVVVLKLGVLGVVLSGVLSSALLGIGLTAYVVYHNRIRFEVNTTLRMLAFCWPMWFAGLAGLYVGSSNRMYLRIFSSLSDVGLLELAGKFAGVTGLLLWTPFSQHWEAVSYKYHKEGTAPRMFPVAFAIVSALMIVGGLWISVFAGPVIEVMAAEAFHGAAAGVSLLTLGFTLNSLVSFFYFSFLVTENTKVFAYTHYATAVVITICYVALIPSLGFIGAAAGQCLAFLVNFLAVHWLAKRFFDTNIRLGGFAVTVTIAVFAYLASTVFLPDLPVHIDLAAKALICFVAMVTIAAAVLTQVRLIDPSSHAAISQAVQGLKNKVARRQPV